jgi:imidazolonepropionase-like amidohydrolase
MKRHALLSLCVAFLSATLAAQERGDAGDVGGSGLALRAAKILTASWDGPQVVDNGVVLVKDGKIEAVGRARELEIPAGYEVVDVGERWLSPGMVELHCHEAGLPIFSRINDINDTVYLANPGMRASTAVKPGNRQLQMALAGGVTTVLYIPGSGSNIGGQGVLVKTAFDKYEEKLVRDPGALKIAQWGNPESWTIGVDMTFENWNTRDTLLRGIAYAKRWQAFEAGTGPEPERNISYDVFLDLTQGEIAIATHTQLYQVVLMTLTMIARDLQLPVFLDHSTIGGWLTGELAQELGVPAIVGPRSLDTTARGMIDWCRNKHEGMRGVAAGYQERGLEMIGFNTDSGIIPQEELLVQGAMGVRYGFDESAMQMVRGLTIVPAKTARIDERLGSLEVGKDADILVSNGHPADPRTAIDIVFVDGRRAYDAERDGRRW